MKLRGWLVTEEQNVDRHAERTGASGATLGRSPQSVDGIGNDRSRFGPRWIVSIAAVAWIGSAVALAGWPTDASQNLLVVGRASGQVIPKIAATSDGGCYIGWFDQASGNFDVYLQHLDAAGNEVWQHGGVLISGHPQNSSLVDWDMIADSDDNAVLVFTDARAGSDLDVYTYRVAGDGSQLWGADGVTLSTNNDFEPAPRLAELTDGSFIFVWPRLPDSADGRLVMQKLSRTGVPQFGGGIEIPGEAGEDPAFSDVAPADNGGYIVSWVRDISSFFSPRHIRAQKFSATGQPLWPGDFVAVFDATSVPIAHTPILIADGLGGAVFGWHRSAANRFNCLVQHVDADGSERFAHNGVAVTTQTDLNHLDPTVAYNPVSDEIFVFWNVRNGGQSQWGIRGQKFNAAGDRVWSAVGVELMPLDNIWQGLPRSEIVGDGAVVMFFDEPTGSTVMDRILAFRLDNAGNSVWTDSPLEISSTLSDKARLPLTVTPSGVVLATWEDNRNGTVDLFAQNVNPNGSLGVLGDLNCDGVVNAFDIEPFLVALFDPDGYPAQFPDCDIDLGDIDGDGAINAFDIEPFLSVLFGP